MDINDWYDKVRELEKVDKRMAGEILKEWQEDRIHLLNVMNRIRRELDQVCMYIKEEGIDNKKEKEIVFQLKKIRYIG